MTTRINRKVLLGATALLAISIAWSSGAHATSLTITLSESGFVNDVFGPSATGALSAGPLAFGTFTVNQISAEDATALGAPGVLNSNAINTSSSMAGTLTIDVESTGLSAATLQAFLSSFAVNALNGSITSVTETTKVDGVTVGTDTFTALGTDVQTSAAVPAGASYTADDIFVITDGGGGTGNDNLTIDMQTVPEPASLALFGTALTGLGLIRRRRRRNV